MLIDLRVDPDLSWAFKLAPIRSRIPPVFGIVGDYVTGVYVTARVGRIRLQLGKFKQIDFVTTQADFFARSTVTLDFNGLDGPPLTVFIRH